MPISRKLPLVTDEISGRVRVRSKEYFYACDKRSLMPSAYREANG